MHKFFAIMMIALFMIQGAFVVADEMAELTGEHAHLVSALSDDHAHEAGDACEATAHGCQHCHTHFVAALGHFKFDPQTVKSFDAPLYNHNIGDISRLLDTPPPKIA